MNELWLRIFNRKTLYTSIFIGIFLLGFFFNIASMYLGIEDLYKLEIIDSQLYVISNTIVRVLLMFVGIIGIIQSVLKPYEQLNQSVDRFIHAIGVSITYLIFIGTFVTALVFFIIILINPEYLMGGLKDQDKLITTQIITSVCLSGLLGGYTREIFNNFLTQTDQNEELRLTITKVWLVFISLLGSVFLSLVFFLLLRAGILKSDKVDTFNIYGVAGIASVTGYFSNNVINRLSKLYKTIFEK
ncbi:MAG: hypothetical protein AAF620_17025 [Bacteroidota bacterium]